MWAHLLLAPAKMFGKTTLLGSLTPWSHQGQMQHSGVRVVQSGASTLAKVLWILGIIIFPVLGFIVWLIAGPK